MNQRIWSTYGALSDLIKWTVQFLWLANQDGEEDGATAVGVEGGEEEAEEEALGADVEAAAEVASHVLDNVTISSQEYEDLKKRWALQME